MYHLKTLAKSPVVKYELAKVLPVATNLTQVRNYADHQIPERLRDVPTAKGKLKNWSKKERNFVSYSTAYSLRFT